MKSTQKYYSHLSDKLLDSKTNLKLYWSVLRTFLNNKQIPCIPPLLHNEKFIMEFKEKAQLFKISLQSSILMIITTVNIPWFLLKKRKIIFNS